ncbi:hypothetical protein PRVXH_000505 [Proteinivorax hydrogeniformans]|uniref:Type I restriction modification DNA specificity domain-containing protein n=1 Tax=Proteinivorax hydrogeniformans TaxID=1826727 RepID=A0AAU8HUX3_9FIRM
MKISQVAKMIHSGQIITRVEAKEQAGDEVIDEKKVLVPKAISNGRVIASELGKVKLKKHVNKKRITLKGDICVKLSNPYDVTYIKSEDEGLVVPSFCAIIRSLDTTKIDPWFLTAFLNTDYIVELLKSRVSGSVMPMIKIADLKELEIPNISIEKQREVGQAFAISTEKQQVLQQIQENENNIIKSIVVNAVKEAK